MIKEYRSRNTNQFTAGLKFIERTKKSKGKRKSDENHRLRHQNRKRDALHISLLRFAFSLSFFVFSLLHWEFLDKLKKKYYSKLKILPATQTQAAAVLHLGKSSCKPITNKQGTVTIGITEKTQIAQPSGIDVDHGFAYALTKQQDKSFSSALVQVTYVT